MDKKNKPFKYLTVAVSLAAFLIWSVSSFFNVKSGYDFGLNLDQWLALGLAAIMFVTQLIIILNEGVKFFAKTGGDILKINILALIAHSISVAAMVFLIFSAFNNIDGNTSTVKGDIAVLELKITNNEKLITRKKEEIKQAKLNKVDQAKIDSLNMQIGAIKAKGVTCELGTKFKKYCAEIKKLKSEIENENKKYDSVLVSKLVKELNGLEQKGEDFTSQKLNKSSQNIKTGSILGLKPENMQTSTFSLLFGSFIAILVELIVAGACWSAWMMLFSYLNIAGKAHKPAQKAHKKKPAEVCEDKKLKLAEIAAIEAGKVIGKYKTRVIEQKIKNKEEAKRTVFDIKNYLLSIDYKEVKRIVDNSLLPKDKDQRINVLMGIVLILQRYKAGHKFIIDTELKEIHENNRGSEFLTSWMIRKWIKPILINNLGLFEEFGNKNKSVSWVSENSGIRALRKAS